MTHYTSEVTVNPVEERIRLSKHGSRLWTRELARKIREDVTAKLEGLNPGDTLVIDLQGVQVFDYSFANELFGRTVLEVPHQFPGRFVVVENLTPYTRENLTKALEGLDLVMIERRGGRLNLLGKFHPTDLETFTVVARARTPVTALELSKKLRVNLTAVNERLSKLSSLGLVRRENTASPAGRRQYEYTVMG